MSILAVALPQALRQATEAVRAALDFDPELRAELVSEAVEDLGASRGWAARQTARRLFRWIRRRHRRLVRSILRGGRGPAPAYRLAAAPTRHPRALRRASRPARYSPKGATDDPDPERPSRVRTPGRGDLTGPRRASAAVLGDLQDMLESRRGDLRSRGPGLLCVGGQR